MRIVLMCVLNCFILCVFNVWCEVIVDLIVVKIYLKNIENIVNF